MRRFLITLTLMATTLVGALAAVNNQRTDSLSRLLSRLTGIEKMKVYEELILENEWTGNFQNTLALCDAWIDYAHLQANLYYEENARNRKLTVIYNEEEWDMLSEEAKKQREWMEKHERWDSYYKAWRDICESYTYNHKPQTALREAEAMRSDAQKRNNAIGLALAYQQMGVIYDFIDHKQAVKAFEKSVELLKAIPEAEGNELLSGYYYLAQALDQTGEHTRELAVCQQWKEALDRTSSGELSSKEKVHYIEYHLWNASALIGLKRLDEADRELTTSEKLCQDINDTYLIYQIQVHRANLAFQQGDIKKAEAYSDLYVPIMNEDHWQLAMRLRGEILMATGRYHDAALFYRQVFEQRDSTFTKDVRMQLDEFNTLFQLDEIRMKGQLERSRFIIFTAVLVSLALLIIVYLRHRASKRLEAKNRELTIANARAEESSRMKTNFIQQISHEIRTPLNILSGFTQIVTTPGIQLDDATKNDINHKITENTDRITGLVNKMLELSDASSQAVISKDDQASASQIAQLAVEKSGITSAAHLHFTLQADQEAEKTLFKTNLHAAARALTMLLDNARKFTRTAEAINHDEIPQEKAIVKLQVSIDHSQAVFTVEDTGIGIPPNESEHIFDEFVQLDQYYDGTGIGLAVARNTVRRLGGDVKLDTTYTTGARFVMTLPLVS